MKQYNKNHEGWSCSDKSLADPENLKKAMDMTIEREERKEIMEIIKEQSIVNLDNPKIAELDAFYETKKPEVKEGQEYSLISIDMRESGDSFTGILNCRVNGEHIQIRF